MEHSLSPKLDRLESLAGTWEMETVFPGQPPSEIRGRTEFEWGPNRAFMTQRWQVPIEEAPDGLAVIAADPGETANGDSAAGALVQNYFDSRGVVRRYEMELEDGLWALTRQAPGFSQRFSGHLSDDGATIDGAWEMNQDGTWEHDFRLIYHRL